MLPKNTLFVSGVARSGTTILAELLNAHPKICLGVERFKFQYLRHQNFSSDFFTKDRFFTFSEEDTNLRPEVSPTWRTLYDTLGQKWDEALVIGDKTPDITPLLGKLLQSYPNSRFLFILRNPEGVAASWQARAQNSKDIHWPATKDYQQAFTSWQKQHEIMARHMLHPHFKRHTMILDYDRLFFEKNDQIASQIQDFLNLPRDPDFNTYLSRLIKENQARLQKAATKTLPAAAQELLETLDRSAYNDLIGQAA